MTEQTVHEFSKSLNVGEQGERTLDAYFGRAFDIIPTKMAEQRLGIDRIFVNKKSRFCYSVEYKTDFKTAQTGNVFMETWSSVGTKRGWGLTSLAQMIVYYLAEPPKPAMAYQVTTIALKNALAGWLNDDKYHTAKVSNGTYTSEGLLIPLETFTTITHRKDLVPWVNK